MHRAHMTILITTMTVLFLCCPLITAAQSDEGKDATAVQATQEASNTTEAQSDSKNTNTATAQSNVEDQPSKKKRTTDFSFNGDRNTQNLNFIFNQPINPKALEGSLEAKFFLTRHEGKTISESWSVQFEGVASHKFFNLFSPGGSIEVEGDLPLENDPLLHVSGYTESKLYPKTENGALVAKAGVGIWIEGQRLRKNPQFSEDFHYGLRAHLDIEWKGFSMLVEYLPELRFDQHAFRVRASPELEIALGNWLSFVLKSEIDLYSEPQKPQLSLCLMSLNRLKQV